MKRKERHQLKEDELKTALSRLYTWGLKHQRELYFALVIAGVVVLVVFGVRLVKAQHLKRESRILSQIIELRQALENKEEQKVGELEKLVGKGRFSRLAYLDLAAFYYEQGKMDKSLSYLEDFPRSPKDTLWVKALDLKAQIFRAQKKYDEALEIYELLEKESPDDFPEDIILFHKAQILEDKGDIKGAIKHYTKLKDEFSQTYFGYEASQRLIQLGEE
jgi:predicted negative regulator of RcsB-dependent stress response